MNWAPRYGEERRKDHSRAQKRAQSLRTRETRSERELWVLLREMNKLDGAHFRRQAHVGQHVYDFADLSRRILIELDGGVHERAEVQAQDRENEIDAILRRYRVLRLTNREVWDNRPAVRAKIKAMLAATPTLPGEGGRGVLSAASGSAPSDEVEGEPQ